MPEFVSEHEEHAEPVMFASTDHFSHAPSDAAGTRSEVSTAVCSPASSADIMVNSLTLVLPLEMPIDPQRCTIQRVLCSSAALPERWRRWDWCMEDFQTIQVIGRGRSCTIHQAYCPNLREVVTLKVYVVAELEPVILYQIHREVDILSKLSHKHIIPLHLAFQSRGCIVLVQKFADAGDLLDVVRRNGGRLTEKVVVKNVLRPLLEAVDYLHSNFIMHRDIKPSNILFTRSGCLMLADFGVAINLAEEVAVTNVGASGFAAPEVRRCPLKLFPDENKDRPDLEYNTLADTWSIGVLVYRLLCGAKALESIRALECYATWEPAFLDFLPGISDAAKLFIYQSLQSNPTMRLNTREMIEHPWVAMFEAVDSSKGSFTITRRRHSMMPLLDNRHMQASKHHVSTAKCSRGGHTNALGGLFPASGYGRSNACVLDNLQGNSFDL